MYVCVCACVQFAVCLKSLSGSLTTVDLSFDEDPDMTVMPDAVYDAVSVWVWVCHMSHV